MAEFYQPPQSAEEAVDRFLAQFARAQNIASDVNAPVRVRARVVQQMGRDVLLAACPSCGTVAGLDGEGRHLCRKSGCHTWLEYVREE